MKWKLAQFLFEDRTLYFEDLTESR